MTETLELPILDAHLFRSGTPSERKDFAMSLRRSLSQHGFARVVNHGISASMVDEMFQWVRASPLPRFTVYDKEAYKTAQSQGNFSSSQNM